MNGDERDGFGPDQVSKARPERHAEMRQGSRRERLKFPLNLAKGLYNQEGRNGQQ